MHSLSCYVVKRNPWIPSRKQYQNFAGFISYKIIIIETFNLSLERGNALKAEFWVNYFFCRNLPSKFPYTIYLRISLISTPWCFDMWKKCLCAQFNTWQLLGEQSINAFCHNTTFGWIIVEHLVYDAIGDRGVPYPVPFITIARDGSNFPGEKMSALLLSIPQWDSFY